MLINQLTENSEATLTLTRRDETLEFVTTIRTVFPEPYRRNVYFVGCDVIEREGKKVTFGGNLVSVQVKNIGDNREYKYPACMVSLNKDRTMLLIFSHYDADPVNYRGAYRVSCNYHTVIQVGNNKKAVEGTMHDISYSGIGMMFLSDEFPNLRVDEKVSASIFDNEEHVYKVNGRIVRFIEGYADNRTLIGVEFVDPSTAIEVLVTKLQRRELRVRKRIEEKKNKDES